jgi:hypothetical protein
VLFSLQLQADTSRSYTSCVHANTTHFATVRLAQTCTHGWEERRVSMSRHGNCDFGTKREEFSGSLSLGHVAGKPWVCRLPLRGMEICVSEHSITERTSLVYVKR